MHKTFVIDWLTYALNIVQPSFGGPFDDLGHRHFPTMHTP